MVADLRAHLLIQTRTMAGKGFGSSFTSSHSASHLYPPSALARRDILKRAGKHEIITLVQNQMAQMQGPRVKKYKKSDNTNLSDGGWRAFAFDVED